MKKVITLLTGIILSAVTLGQFSWGVQAYGTLSDASIAKNEVISITKKMRAFPGGGVVAEYQVTPNLAIRSGINFLQHGITLNTSGTTQVEEHVGELKAEAKSNLNYLQAPLNILYTTSGENLQFFAGGGPFINYGISGKVKLKSTFTIPGEDPIKFDDENEAFEKGENGGGFKRIDFGVGVIAGIKLQSGLFVNAGYQLSLSNINDTDGDKYKNRGLQLTIGRMF